MKPRIVLVAVLSVLVLAVGLAWFLWPRHSLLRLKVLRQTVEQGKPVVIFRLEVADSRRVAIRNVERITVDKTDSPYKEFGFSYSRPMPTPAFAFGAFSNTVSLGLLRPANEFWAPSQSSPLFDLTRSRRAFGVLVPANAAVWRLRVKVEIEDDPSVRFKRSLVQWRFLRKHGISVYETTKYCWQMFNLMGSAVVESELITKLLSNAP